MCPPSVPSALYILCYAALGTTAACGSSDGAEASDDMPGSHNPAMHGSDDAGGALASVDCEEETRADSFTTGMNKSTKGGTVVSLVEASPAPPARNNNDWVLELTDEEGELIVDAAIALNPFMPDHGHGSPREPVVKELGEGRYSAGPIAFFMPGYWSVEIEVRREELPAESVSFGFCIP